jgi:hypothetical protein
MSQPSPNPASARARLPRLPVPRRWGLTVPAVVVAALALAACGGSGSPSASNAASKEQAAEQKAETRLADFAKCMREHGVNAETASGPGGGHGLKISGASGGPAAMEAAQKACARYRPEPKKVNLSPQQKVEQEEGVDKFARCMREHGIKVEASTASGGVQIRIHSSGSSGSSSGGEPNPESPGFQKARSTCQKLLPRPPGAPGAKSGEGGQVAGG